MQTEAGKVQGAIWGWEPATTGYKNAGLYEGGDQTVKREQSGHSMVHSIQSSRKTKVVVNNIVYSGIPHETCVSCHKEIPSGRFVYRVISNVGDYLGMIPKTDAQHQRVMERAMFIAANVEIFGGLVAAIVVFILIIYFIRRRAL